MHVLRLIVAKIATNCSIVSQICLFVREKVIFPTVQNSGPSSLVLLFAVFICAMTKNFKVLRTYRGSVAMAAIYLIMFGIIFYE